MPAVWVGIAVFLSIQAAIWTVRLLYRGPILRKLDVEMVFSVAYATEGDTVQLSTTLTNEKWLPMPWVAVKFRVSRNLLFADATAHQISDEYYRQDLYHILMFQRVTRRFSFVCGKRGFYPIQGLDISGWDMLMEYKSARFLQTRAALTVYPRALETQELDAICTSVYGQLQSFLPMHPDPFSFRGLRAYTENDPIKAINFKASAKGAQHPGQELMVNLWEFTNNRRVVLMLNFEKHNLWHADAQDEYNIKLAVGFAARLAEAHVPLRFITNGIGAEEGTDLPEGRGFTHHENILDVLAHVDIPRGVSESFSALLTNITEEDSAEYIIISTYHGADLEEAYDRLLAQGRRICWVLPCHQGIILDTQNMRESLRSKVVLV
ncbi:MAG: DUF58 domain-containing protein [Defluviitaleaceae bacterium]|nr:DUF58 domain-containing protein [Defluviitaleaceae bacterium]MCL2275858.1 DUF58 domain-containing protein [Defluviitaleaceae bacterium]